MNYILSNILLTHIMKKINISCWHSEVELRKFFPFLFNCFERESFQKLVFRRTTLFLSSKHNIQGLEGIANSENTETPELLFLGFLFSHVMFCLIFFIYLNFVYHKKTWKRGFELPNFQNFLWENISESFFQIFFV